MKKLLKRMAMAVLGLVSVAAIFVAVCYHLFSKLEEEQFPMHQELAALVHAVDAKPDVELGKRIYTVRNGCIECHGPDLSGVPVVESGAIGSLHGANITPYKTRALSDEDLVRAIRYGVHHTGRSLRFMPSFDFAGLSIEDMRSLVAYIRSVPPVEKPDHVNTIGPVARVMSVLGKMPIVLPARVIDHAQGFTSKPAEGPTVEFGKYLANSCAGCHGADYRGGKIPGGDPSWPAAMDIRMGGKSGWTQAAFISLAKSGISRKTGEKLRLPMPYVALQHMSDVELDALWKFLSSLD